MYVEFKFKFILFYSPRIKDKNSNMEESELMKICDRLKTDFPAADKDFLLDSKLILEKNWFYSRSMHVIPL